MSNRNDPSQGMVKDKRPQPRPVAKPDTKALMRADQRAINRQDAALTRQKPAQSVGGKENWRRG